MDQELDKLINEFEKKLKESNEINNEMARLLKSMNKLIKTERENKNKSETLARRYTNNIDSDIVKFNIGGIIFSTYKTTINKKICKPHTNEYYAPNLLEELINGRVDVKLDDNKAIFIDRNPKYFHFILNYLRTVNTNEKFEYPANYDLLKELFKEADFYHVYGLVDSYNFLGDCATLDLNQSKQLYELCQFASTDKWTLLYRGSLHGFGALDFHSRCDGVAKTLTVIKTKEGYLFGKNLFGMC